MKFFKSPASCLSLIFSKPSAPAPNEVRFAISPILPISPKLLAKEPSPEPNKSPLPPTLNTLSDALSEGTPPIPPFVPLPDVAANIGSITLTEYIAFLSRVPSPCVLLPPNSKPRFFFTKSEACC